MAIGTEENSQIKFLEKVSMSQIYLKNYRHRQKNLEVDQTFDVWYKGSEKEKEL